MKIALCNEFEIKEGLRPETEDPCKNACKLAKDGKAGMVLSKDASIVPCAVKELKVPGSIVSELSIFSFDEYLFLTDTNMNIFPSSEDLGNIANSAITFIKDMGISPRTAFVSFASKGSRGNQPAIDHIREAVAIAKKKFPKEKIDGELQVDAALDRNYAVPGSQIQGNANLLVFPNLAAADIFRGTTRIFGVGLPIAKVLLGLKVPVVISDDMEFINKLG